mmetsp:Transcript_40913/g.162017  ORF Transcript_40913/g.162017 Transcript_40913/m.162017 type:complete len:126 (+) Transcript_40913:2533-2910(+)
MVVQAPYPYPYNQQYGRGVAVYMPYGDGHQHGNSVAPNPNAGLANPAMPNSQVEKVDKVLARKIQSREAAVRQRERQNREYNELYQRNLELTKRASQLQEQNEILRKELSNKLGAIPAPDFGTGE